MIDKPFTRIARSDLESLMTALEVSFLKLTECLISPGWRLTINPYDAPAIHYNLAGSGRMLIGTHSPIPLSPHMLIIAPRALPVVIEGPSSLAFQSECKTVNGKLEDGASGKIQKFIVGEGEPKALLICGYFRARYGTSIDLFESLSAPIVESFSESHQLDQKLKSALKELTAQEIGMAAMTTSLFKQVLIALLRRSLSSTDVWVERFSMLADPQIARAFALMTAQPCAPHSIQSLSQAVALSRSAFMSRFTAAIGQSPIAVLRRLRMRHAASLLTADVLSIDQIARHTGYDSRTAFSRAFRKIYGVDPSEYRGTVHGSLEDDPKNVATDGFRSEA